MSGLAGSALMLYGVVIAYLAVLGVPPRRIGWIVLLGVVSGLALAFTLGFAYFFIVLVRPVETISVFSMAGIVLAAAHTARDRILGHTTPLGIILLNVAANLLPAPGPLPLSFVGLAALIPLPYGPLRIALNLALLYSPALAALWLLRQGPPGSAWLRYLLGAWLCWIGLAVTAGPGWSALSQVRLEQPLSWLAGGLGALAGVHLLMLALNLFASLAGKDEDSARSVARSVRVDGMAPSHAVAWAAAFAVVLLLWRRSPFGEELKTIAAVGVALFFAWQMRAAPAAEEAEHRSPSLSVAGGLFLFVAVLGTVAVWLWRETHPESRAANLRLDPATGRPLIAHPAGMMLHYDQPELQAMLKEALAKEGVPYTSQVLEKKEYLKVEEKDRAAAKRASDELEGPPLPANGAVSFGNAARQQAFTDWLTAKNVAWKTIRKRLDTYVVWDEGPRHALLLRAYEDEQRQRYVGVDYYALYVVAGLDPAKLAEARIAAFAMPEQQKAFIEWLRKAGVRPELDLRGGREFVVWEGGKPDLLREYKGMMHRACLEDYRARTKGAPPGSARNPC